MIQTTVAPPFLFRVVELKSSYIFEKKRSYSGTKIISCALDAQPDPFSRPWLCGERRLHLAVAGGALKGAQLCCGRTCTEPMMSTGPRSASTNNSQFPWFANLIAASTAYIRKVSSDCEMGRRASLVSSRARFADHMAPSSRSPGHGGAWSSQGAAACGRC